RKIYRQGDSLRAETVKDAEHNEDGIHIVDLKTGESLYLHTGRKLATPIRMAQQEMRLLAGMMGDLSGIKAALADGDEKPVKDLGEQKVGDRTTKAYEIRGKTPPGTWTVWVDPKTELPVRIRLAEEGAKSTFTLDFADWNKEHDPKLFSREVPE